MRGLSLTASLSFLLLPLLLLICCWRCLHRESCHHVTQAVVSSDSIFEEFLAYNFKRIGALCWKERVLVRIRKSDRLERARGSSCGSRGVGMLASRKQRRMRSVCEARFSILLVMIYISGMSFVMESPRRDSRERRHVLRSFQKEKRISSTQAGRQVDRWTFNPFGHIYISAECHSSWNRRDETQEKEDMCYDHSKKKTEHIQGAFGHIWSLAKKTRSAT